jgi:hypothetical protein
MLRNGPTIPGRAICVFGTAGAWVLATAEADPIGANGAACRLVLLVPDPPLVASAKPAEAMTSALSAASARRNFRT